MMEDDRIPEPPAFATGDVVRLKSGGFPMTVSSDEGSALECLWHDANGQPHTEEYRGETLVKATATDLATGEEVTIDTAFNAERPLTWRDRRGL